MENRDRRPLPAEANQDFNIRKTYLKALGHSLDLRGKVLDDGVDCLLGNIPHLIDLHRKSQNVLLLQSQERLQVIEEICELGTTFLQEYKPLPKIDLIPAIGVQVLDLCVEEPNSIVFKNLAWRMSLITKSPELEKKIESYVSSNI